MTTRGKLLLRAMIAGASAAVVSVGLVAYILRLEARALAECRDNLGTISLALANYQSEFGTYPAGTVPNPALRPYKRLSWLTTVMNYMEAGTHLQIDTTEAWDSDQNRTPHFVHTSTTADPAPSTTLATNLAFLRCPANDPKATRKGAGMTDYVGIAGLGADAATLPITHSRAGVFGYDRATRLQDITDGASVTMMIAETAEPRGSWTAGGLSTVRGVDPKRRPYLGRYGQFGRKHRGGAMTVFADGSVRFVRDSVDPEVFESLATIGGGEEIPPGITAEGQSGVSAGTSAVNPGGRR